MVPLGTGSDGGGSIRIPAALCGLTGLKTEAGRIPITGRAMPGSGLLSTNGPMGRSALDSAIALDAVVGPDDRDPLSQATAGESWAQRVRAAELPERVIWAPTFGFATVDDEVAAACRAAVDALEAAGTEVIELDTIWPEDPVMTWLVLWTVSRFKAQGHLIDTPDWERLSESIKPQIVMGSKVTGAEFMRAQDACYDLNWQLQDALDRAPLVLCPTAAGQTPRLGEDGTVNGEAQVGWVQLTYGLNMTRNPAGSVCAGLSSAGMPIGLQVIGRHRQEGDVLAAMAAVEELLPVDARPPIS